MLLNINIKQKTNKKNSRRLKGYQKIYLGQLLSLLFYFLKVFPLINLLPFQNLGNIYFKLLNLYT